MNSQIHELQQKISILEDEVKNLKNILNLSIIDDKSNNCRRLLVPNEKNNVLNYIKLLISSINSDDILHNDIVISTNGSIDLLSNVLNKNYHTWQRWYEQNKDT